MSGAASKAVTTLSKRQPFCGHRSILWPPFGESTHVLSQEPTVDPIRRNKLSKLS